jgi:hypothetical protein
MILFSMASEEIRTRSVSKEREMNRAVTGPVMEGNTERERGAAALETSTMRRRGGICRDTVQN